MDGNVRNMQLGHLFKYMHLFAVLDNGASLKAHG